MRAMMRPMMRAMMRATIRTVIKGAVRRMMRGLSVPVAQKLANSAGVKAEARGFVIGAIA